MAPLILLAAAAEARIIAANFRHKIQGAAFKPMVETIKEH